ncbi:MAG TPA: hypothetical protein VF229_05195 [Burkholderiaceae bacterium]
MDPSRNKAQRLVALCMFGCLLFNYPVLALFDRPVRLLGLPLGYAYVFGAWTLLIALTALAVRRGGAPAP